MSVKRFDSDDVYPGMRETDDGEYVLLSDHDAVIADLMAKLAQACAERDYIRRERDLLRTYYNAFTTGTAVAANLAHAAYIREFGGDDEQ